MLCVERSKGYVIRSVIHDKIKFIYGIGWDAAQDLLAESQRLTVDLLDYRRVGALLFEHVALKDERHHGLQVDDRLPELVRLQRKTHQSKNMPTKETFLLQMISQSICQMSVSVEYAKNELVTEHADIYSAIS